MCRILATWFQAPDTIPGPLHPPLRALEASHEALVFPHLLATLLDPNASVRKRAYQTIETLLFHYQDPDAVALRTRQTEQFRSAKLKDKRSQIHQWITERATETLPTILRMADHKQHVQLYEDAFAAILQWNAKEAREWLLNQLLNPSKDESEIAIGLEAMRTIGLGSKEQQRVLSLAESGANGFPSLRGIFLVGELQITQGTETLRSIIAYASPQATREIAESCAALVAIHTEEASTALRELFQESTPPKQLYIATALCMFGLPDGKEALLQALQDRFSPIPHAILIDALGELKDPALLSVFIERLDPIECRHNSRIAAIEALRKLGSPKAIDVLQACLADLSEYESIKRHAALALAWIAPEALNPTRDKTLQQVLDADRYSNRKHSMGIEDTIDTLTMLAKHSLSQLEQPEHTLDATYQECLRQRNRSILPALKAYQKATLQEERFQKHRGLPFLQLVQDSIETWETLNTKLNRSLLTNHSDIDPETFSTLRQLLALTPNKQNWYKLCSFLEKWPTSEGLEMGIAYACQHLEEWPTELRQSPYSWFHDILALQYQPRFQIVRHLALQSYTQSTQEKIAFLEALPASYEITFLDISRSYLNSKSAESIAQLPCLQHVRHLSILYNNVGAKGLVHFLTSPHLKQLESLNVESNNIGNKGALLFAEDHQLTQLHTLNLRSNRISDSGAKALAETSFLPALRRLQLGVNNISPDAQSQLLKSTQREHTSIEFDERQELDDIAF
jgi:HEAT repeat protein